MAVTLGLDLGTSSARGVVLDPDLRVRATAERQYPLLSDRPGWSEQDPAHWWAAVCALLQELTGQLAGEEVLGIAFSGQMHGLVPLASDGGVLRNAILWNDQRTGREARIISDAVGDRELIRRTGNPAITGFQLPKILWLREHEPERFRRLSLALLPKDWLTLKLTGEAATEPSDASGCGCLNLEGGDWDDAVLAAVGLDRSILPPVRPTGSVVGRVTKAAAAETGLQAGVPVLAGAGDNAAANLALGLGTHRPGLGSLSLGTSGVIFAPLDAPEPDPEGRVHLFGHADGRYCLLGVTLAAGGSLAWFRRVMMNSASFERITELAEGTRPGAGGVTFHPYLSGERSPLLDPDLRGSFSGLSLATGPGELARAVLEGVAFSLLDVADVMRRSTRLTGLLALGGGAASDFWLQMFADVLKVEIMRPTGARDAAWGAALLAQHGVGAREGSGHEPGTGTVFRPGPADYRAARERYLLSRPASLP